MPTIRHPLAYFKAAYSTMKIIPGLKCRDFACQKCCTYNLRKGLCLEIETRHIRKDTMKTPTTMIL